MIRSMTSFGEAEATTPAGTLRVELRSVNHRYLNINARLPSVLARWEPEIREWLRPFFTRGHVNLTIRLDRDASDLASEIRLDYERVAAYLALFEELGTRFEVPGKADVGVLSRFSDIFVREEASDEETEVAGDALREALERAATAALGMRDEEGRRLAVDLEERLAAIDGAIDEIEALAPERLVIERDRLRAAVAELAQGYGVDEERIAREIAILAERWDINEELVRFRSHIVLFRELLASRDEEAVGKRLGFLVQEMHREANTTGAKANDARIAHLVVAIKEEIERLREQVENVE